MSGMSGEEIIPFVIGLEQCRKSLPIKRYKDLSYWLNFLTLSGSNKKRIGIAMNVVALYGHMTKRTCQKCGKKTVRVQLWESSDGGYEDEKFTCETCGHVYWVDGIDS